MATTTQFAVPDGYKVANVSNFAAFGIHYTMPGSDTLYGITVLRGTEHISVDSRVNGTWYTTRVVRPERFTDGHDIVSPKQFAAVVAAWFAAAGTDSSGS